MKIESERESSRVQAVLNLASEILQHNAAAGTNVGKWLHLLSSGPSTHFGLNLATGASRNRRSRKAGGTCC